MTPSAHPALVAACTAAQAAHRRALADHPPSALREVMGLGADGTETSRLDLLVEAAILHAVEPFRVNILSEECGYIDVGADVTLAIDPVDGTGNAAAGLPVSAFTAAVAREGAWVEALTCWFETGQVWWAERGRPTVLATSGQRSVAGALVSMIRPKAAGEGFLAVAAATGRTRVFGSTSLECAWVASGVLDAFLDPGTDTHRIVDLAAAVVLVEAAGGVVVDLHGRSLGFTTDITGRWSGIAAATPQLAAELIDLVLAGSPAVPGSRP